MRCRFQWILDLPIAAMLLAGLIVGLSTRAIADDTGSADSGDAVEIGDLRLVLPPLESLTELPGLGDQLKGHWQGSLGSATVRIAVRVYPSERFGFRDPADVSRFLASRYEDSFDDFEADSEQSLRGRYGVAPYASLVRGALPQKMGQGSLHILGGIVPDLGYSIEVFAFGSPDESALEHIDEFLRKGITSTVEPWDPGWSMEEIRARWERDVPFDKKGLKKPLRTAHFLILTNTSAAGRLFAKKMEEAYKKVKVMFPFPETEGERLMPVFIFKTRDEYIQFYMHIAGTTRENAAQSKGHAWKDYYATYYDSPQAPVHIHEATHQIFSNRLRLGGGGSWFQEGVAEYCSSTPNQRKAFARRYAKDRKHIPFETFVQLPRLISNPHLEAQEAYLQAASLTEFLCERWNKHKFPEYVVKMGSLPRGDLEKIEAAFLDVYGVGLKDVEEAWLDYWSRR